MGLFWVFNSQLSDPHYCPLCTILYPTVPSTYVESSNWFLADFCNLIPLGGWLTLLPTAWTFSCVWHSAALISPPTWVLVQCSPVLNDTSIIKTWISKNKQEYSCSKVRLDSNDPNKINWKHGVSFKDFFFGKVTVGFTFQSKIDYFSFRR